MALGVELTIKDPIKLDSPKISSVIFFKFACSESSIDIKITPSSVSKFLANFSRGYIMFNQSVWYLPFVSELVLNLFPALSICFVCSK